MKLEEIKSIAKLHGIKMSKMNKCELVRAIQQAEGNYPCFASGNASLCDQDACVWRADCV